MKTRGLDKFKACLLDALTCVPTIANFIAPSKVWIKWDGIYPPGQVGSGEGSNQGSSTLDEEENNLGK
jgi:hypothetical protein